MTRRAEETPTNETPLRKVTEAANQADSLRGAEGPPAAVAVGGAATLFADPSGRTAPLETLSEGEPLEVQRSLADLAKVRTAGGLEGYVAASAVGGGSQGAQSRCASVLFPVTLFAEPSLSSLAVRELRRGEFVEIVAERGQFLMVQDQNGDIGFVGRRAVVTREPASPTLYELRDVRRGMPPGQPHADSRTEYGGFGERLAAILLDGLFVALLSAVPASVIGLAVFAAVYPSDQLFVSQREAEEAVNAGASAGLWVWIAIWWVYVWIGTALGGTWGKRLVGLRVVRERDGEAPGFGSALVRTIVAAAIGYPIGALWMLWDNKKRGLYDIGAGTVVVRVRRP